jgi:hypothetical protein
VLLDIVRSESLMLCAGAELAQWNALMRLSFRSGGEDGSQARYYLSSRAQGRANKWLILALAQPAAFASEELSEGGLEG